MQEKALNILVRLSCILAIGLGIIWLIQNTVRGNKGSDEQFSRIEEIASRKVLHDEFPETAKEALFFEMSEFSEHNNLKFNLSEEEIRIFLGILRTGNFDALEVKRPDGVLKSCIEFFDDENPDMVVMISDSGEMYSSFDNQEDFERVNCEELTDYFNELVEKYKNR